MGGRTLETQAVDSDRYQCTHGQQLGCGAEQRVAELSVMYSAAVWVIALHQSLHFCLLHPRRMHQPEFLGC